CRFFFQAEDVIRDFHVTGVQTCALPISSSATPPPTAPPDEVYRDLEEEPPSQLPFILTAFGLLALLVVLVFVLFQALGGEDAPEMVVVPNVANLPEADAGGRLPYGGP